MTITRRPLREQIRDEVLTRLVRGDHPVGERINEGELADELGVSRTPLREALAGLAQEGVLELRPNRGFWLLPLTVDEVKETYPIIGALEAFALRQCDIQVLAESVPRLNELAQRMLDVDPLEAGRIDDQWHDELLKSCPNKRLLQLIKAQKTVVHRYEFAYFTSRKRIMRAETEHRLIAKAILERDMDRAAGELVGNWTVDPGVLREVFG
ncbi:GntR family transcriptional regulator [Kibdelosporangium persicum]|uniref:DNA-binding GntR family transcriptional regulator n=1 Tax=Kibdelosporangium persicum TaxID=2698649 RepID=A0ABX2EXK4_9PSEU|nr:GntR family transcriptional regulator [Kibdelosporangium persicum]NRN63739.1 DNA-binding GntR family transcriptional regulator [Kibdelosporangium persicum]